MIGIKETFKRYRTAKRTMNELSRLTDRELSDIGIARCDIRAVSFNRFG
jgi:uncharacterized protein YjiS (DUF1127 family)